MVWALPLVLGVFFLVEGLKAVTAGAWPIGLLVMAMGGVSISWGYRRRLRG